MGSKWLVVTVEMELMRGEVSIPMKGIRLVDESKKKHPLLSIGGGEPPAFTDFREYDKYQQVKPPKLVIRSAPHGTVDSLFLFAVPTRDRSFVLEL